MARTNKCFTPFVDEVIKYYVAGHSVKDTAAMFGVTIHQVNHWVKVRRVSNGRTISEINKEKAAKANAKAIAETGARLEQKMSEQGFDLVSDYQGGRAKVILRCRKCGEQFERNAKHLSKDGARCPACIETVREQNRREREAFKLAEKEQKVAEKEKREQEKLAANPLGLSYYQLSREKILDLPHNCKVCGKIYTVRIYMESVGAKYKRDFGFCSKECREAQRIRLAKESSRRRGAHCEHHYDRAVRLGLPAERGVTLKKLYERDQGICQICGMVCIYSGDVQSDLYPSIDHIIPMNNDPLKQGGHTWKNVQLAHRICNSNKRDYVGKEWHNGN